MLVDGTVGGQTIFAPPTPQIDGTLVKIPLVHQALVFDPTRNRHYASIPGSVPSNGNRIAMWTQTPVQSATRQRWWVLTRLP